MPACRQKPLFDPVTNAEKVRDAERAFCVLLRSHRCCTTLRHVLWQNYCKRTQHGTHPLPLLIVLRYLGVCVTEYGCSVFVCAVSNVHTTLSEHALSSVSALASALRGWQDTLRASAHATTSPQYAEWVAGLRACELLFHRAKAVNDRVPAPPFPLSAQLTPPPPPPRSYPLSALRCWTCW